MRNIAIPVFISKLLLQKSEVGYVDGFQGMIAVVSGSDDEATSP
jgi:hypothetical protein